MSTRRKRLLFIVPSFVEGAGGAERVASILLRHLDRERFELHLALVKGGSGFWHELPADVSIHELGVKRMRYALTPLLRAIRRISPDVIVSTVVFANVNLLLARRLLPSHTRLVIREATTPSAFIAQGATHPSFWRWAYRRLYRRADKIVVLSDAMLRDLAETFSIPHDKLVRIYNPVDADGIRRAASAAPDPYRGDGPNVLAVGRLAHEKGFDLLLDAMAAVSRLLPEARLTILGEGALAVGLKAQSRQLGLEEKIHFAGFQPNPWPYFRHADVVVVPSRYEGLPNVVLEALALGTPVVATDCPGGTREIANITGEVQLIPVDDVVALADAIASVCKTGRRTPAAEDGLKAFRVENAVAAYAAVLT